MIEALPFLPNGEENNLKVNEKNIAINNDNWSNILKDRSFVLRIVLCIIAIIISSLIILNVTLDSKSTAWYNRIYKPDWMPESIPFVIITTFFILLFGWTWYRVSKSVSGYTSWIIDFLFLSVLILYVVWSIVLYGNQNIFAGRWLISFLTGAIFVCFLVSFYYTRFSDATLFAFILLGWFILNTCVVFNMHELEKEYKILGLVKDTNSSLYRKKMKLEMVEGIKVDENGNKTEFDPNEQE